MVGFGRIWLVIALVAMALSCDQLSPHVTASENHDDGTGAIVIGHYGSMTGAEATFGQSTDKGVRLAIDERNAAGGVKGRLIELVTIDDAGKSQEAGTAVTRLITEYHVKAILGEVASSLSKAGGAVAQKYRVPMVSPSSTNESVTLIGNMIFRVCFIDGFQGYVVAKFARDNLKASRVGVLYDQQQAYSKGLAKEFDHAFRALGGTITTSQAYTGGDVDLSAQLQSLKDTNPEAIFLPGYYTDAGNIARQARKLGITVPLLGGDGWDSEKLTEIGGDAIEGSYYANHYSFEEARPAVQNFVAKFKARYDEVPDGLAALGYDAALVLFAAMDRAKSLDGGDLAEAIAQTTDFPAVTGIITLDKNRNPMKSAVMLVVKNGKPHYSATVDPPTEPLPEIKDVEDTGGGEASMMTKLLQTLVNSLALGALYALIALGYTLVYGVLRFINFAHSDVFTFGAWISFTFASWFGWAKSAPAYSLPVILILAMVTCSALGVTIERLAYRPLRNAPRLNVLITAIGVSLLLQNTGTLSSGSSYLPSLVVLIVLNLAIAIRAVKRQTSDLHLVLLANAAIIAILARAFSPVLLAPGLGAVVAILASKKPGERSWIDALVRVAVTMAAFVGLSAALDRGGVAMTATVGPSWAFGPNPQHMPALVADRSLVTIMGVHLRLVDVVVFALAIALVLTLQFLVYKTKLGRAMRAVSFDERVAALMGINVNRVVTITFAVGSALAAAGGLLFALKYESLQITAGSQWVLLGLTAFVAAVVGGIGDVRGAAVGALLIAAVQEFGAAYLSTQLRDVYVFTILIIVLLVKPSGLFGRAVVEKV